MTTEPLSEAELLHGLDAYGAHADELATPTTQQIFAFRAFDLRDRFPAPFPDFRRALEALQSDTAYLPEMSGEIVAYCRDGRTIPIPSELFMRTQPRFRSRNEAEEWVRDRLTSIKQGDALARLKGAALCDPNAPFEKQIEEALTIKDKHMVSPSENDAVCEQVERWLVSQQA